MTSIEVPTPLPGIDDVARQALFTEARTANSFAPTPVTDEQLRAIWELAKWPPTAANMQPLRVVFARTDEGRARIVEHMADGNKAKTASAPVVAVLAADHRFHEHAPTVFPIREGMREHLEGQPEQRAKMAETGAWLQAGYFIMAVRAEGLAAGPMGGFDAEGLNRELFPDGRHRAILVVNIGHPGADPWFDRLPRLADDEVLTWV